MVIQNPTSSRHKLAVFRMSHTIQDMCFKRYATSLWDPLCSQKMHVQLQQGYDAQSANLVTVLFYEQCKCKSYRHLLQATNKASPHIHFSDAQLAAS